MADEMTLTSHNDVYLAAEVSSMILDEARPQNVTGQFYRHEGPGNSPAYDFPIQDDPGAAAAGTEATTFANTALTSSKATATVGIVGQMTTVTDQLKVTSLVDIVPHAAGVIGRSVEEKKETDYTALLDNFSNTTGTSGQDLTWAQWLEAISQLEQRDAQGSLVGVLHPVQVGDLRADVGTSAAAYFGNPNASINGMDASALNGYVGNPASVPLFQTSLVPETAGNKGGAVFVAGVALGCYTQWDTRIELERDASLPGTEAVATAYYGVIEIRDAWGESVITDA